jgi:4-aminobutyrate--pyruvate transaminase
MISDEVICGFGRLGSMFGCDTLGFKPDALSIAKAMSSAYVPIAAVMIPENLYQALLIESNKVGSFGHGFTYGGHPVAAAVALKAIEIYTRDRVIEKAAKRAPLFQARLKMLGRHPLVGEARGLGLIGGIELVADKAAKRSFAAQHGVGARAVEFAEQEGLIIRAVGGDTLALSPPLVIGAAEIEELFDRLTRALDKTLDWVTRERLARE